MLDSRAKHLEDHIVWGKFTDAAWHGDGFYYSAYDVPLSVYSGRTNCIKFTIQNRHTQSEDKLYFSNPKYPLRFYSVSLNDEESMMFLYESGMGNGNLLYVKDLTKKNAPFVKMVDDYELQYSPIGTVGKRIYLYTNYGASMGRIMVADISKPGLENWKEVLGESKDAIDGVSIIGGKLIVTYLADACSRAALFDLDGKFIRDIDLPGIGSVYFAGVQDEPDCYYSFTSITSPATIYKYDLDSGESSLYAQPKLAFNPDDFTTEEIFYPSKDGTQIPMFITYKKGLKLNGKNPTLLYGYGGFNVSMTPYFTPRRIPFLENGGIYAQPSIRGGGEYGKEWHLAGTKMQSRMCLMTLSLRWNGSLPITYRQQAYITMGGSNGGFVGACMTELSGL